MRRVLGINIKVNACAVITGRFWVCKAARTGKEDLDVLWHSRLHATRDCHEPGAPGDLHVSLELPCSLPGTNGLACLQGHDCSADLWSLGILIYEMLCGRYILNSICFSQQYSLSLSLVCVCVVCKYVWRNSLCVCVWRNSLTHSYSPSISISLTTIVIHFPTT